MKCREETERARREAAAPEPAEVEAEPAGKARDVGPAAVAWVATPRARAAPVCARRAARLRRIKSACRAITSSARSAVSR